MLENLQTEIDRYPELIGASKQIICNKINNTPANVESWVVRSDEHKVPIGDMFALLSLASQVKLYDWMEAKTDPAKGFLLFYNKHDQFKVSDPVFRGTLELMCDPLLLITETERDAILRFGERLQTRAEELFGRDITEGDFE